MAETTLPADALPLASRFEAEANALLHVASVLRSASTAESVVVEAQGRKAAVEDQIARLNQQVQDLRVKAGAAADAVEAAKAELVPVRDALRRAEDELAHVRGELDNLERAMLGAQQARDVAERDRAALAAEIQSRQTELDAIINRSVERIEALTTEEEDARAKLEKAKADHAAFIRSLTGAPA